MEKTFKTKYGEITLRTAMIDLDGTNLIDGVEIKQDGKLIGEILHSSVGYYEDCNIEEIEQVVEKHCEFY